MRGSGATIPTTRSRRATTAAATTRQRMKITRMSSAFQGACVSWRLEFPEIRNNSPPLNPSEERSVDGSGSGGTGSAHGANVQKMLEDSTEKMRNNILRYQRRRKPIKFNMAIHVDFMQATDESIVTFPPVVLVTDQMEVFQDTDVDELLKKCAVALGDRIVAYEGNGSGWVVDKLIWLDTAIWRYDPLRGDSFIPLPAWISSTKCVVNVQNKDNECYRHSVMAALYDGGHDKQRVSSYTRFYDQDDAPNFEGLEYPLQLNDIRKFEANNPDISVHVYGEVTTSTAPTPAISAMTEPNPDVDQDQEDIEEY